MVEKSNKSFLLNVKHFDGCKGKLIMAGCCGAAKSKQQSSIPSSMDMQSDHFILKAFQLSD